MGARQILNHVRGAPLLLAYRLVPRLRPAIDRDILRFHQQRLDLPLPAAYTRDEMMEAFSRREFRSVLYARLRAESGAGHLLALLLPRICPGQVAFEYACDDIGPGLVLSHGFATIVSAQRIGTDCLISQQVTIGTSDKGGPPVIGDRVRIGAGALVLGPVTVGDDAVVGAGAVVIDDVPPGAVVAGVPARVLPNASDAFSAKARGR